MPADECPQEMRELWAVAQQVLMHWREHQEHPACPVLRRELDKHMNRLRAACTRAQDVMDAVRGRAQ